jgi:hypothetical protein
MSGLIKRQPLTILDRVRALPGSIQELILSFKLYYSDRSWFDFDLLSPGLRRVLACTSACDRIKKMQLDVEKMYDSYAIYCGRHCCVTHQLTGNQHCLEDLGASVESIARVGDWLGAYERNGCLEPFIHRTRIVMFEDLWGKWARAYHESRWG